MAACSCGSGICQPKSLIMPTISYHPSSAGAPISPWVMRMRWPTGLRSPNTKMRERLVHDEDVAAFDIDRREIPAGDDLRSERGEEA